MKILHTADLQIGESRSFPDYLERQEKMIDEIYKTAIKNKVDYVLMAGDIFHRKQVLEKERNMFLSKLLKYDKKITTIITNGNHDELDPGCTSITFLKLLEQSKKFKNTYVIDNDVTLLHLKGLDVLVVPDCNSVDFEQVVRANVKNKQNNYFVVVTHGTFKGVSNDIGHKSRTGADPSVFNKIKGVTYYALGDWHKCIAMAKTAWYSGSPIQHNFGEYLPKGVLIVDLDKATKPVLVALDGIKPLVVLDEIPEEWPNAYIKLNIAKDKLPKNLPQDVVKLSTFIKEQEDIEISIVDDLLYGITDYMAKQGLDKTDQNTGINFVQDLMKRI